jgi:hypothetical protein
VRSDQILQKIRSDIILLTSQTTQLNYLSGQNTLTSVSFDPVNNIISAKRTGDTTVSVPYEHLQKVSNAFAENPIVDINTLFQSGGNARSAMETVLAHLPNIGYLPANKSPNTGPKKLVWFDIAVNKLGDTFDACHLLLANKVSGATLPSASLEPLIDDFLTSAKNTNLVFESQLIARFFSSLLAKRFVLLCGLSGSGKTKLAEACALWLCESETQFQLVAVGADWTSNENLLGYADALNPGNYVVPGNGVLQLLIRAIDDPSKPYFLILDEMNLSHVERYFADFLSAIESSNAALAIHGQGSLEAGIGKPIPEKLNLPTNLFIIGTVNVDETTYMFSPKVLDRANVIEFRATKEQMAVFLDEPTGTDLQQFLTKGVAYAPAFVSRAQADADISTVSDASGLVGPRLKDDLLEVFATLEAIGGEFGFRTAKEIARFVVIHHELSGSTWEYKHALDAQVLQKLMPKLHGSARKLSGVLDGLKAFGETHTLPLTLEKVQRMQARLKRDGFTSFAEN